MPRFVPLACLFTLLAAPLAAQGSVVGSWKISYPAGTRVENGEQTAIMGTALLRIERSGDSLVGELVPDPMPDAPARPPSRMGGREAGGVATLVRHFTATLEVNGASQQVAGTSTWRLEVRGEALEGTLSHEVDAMGVMAQDPGPVRGTRQGP